MVYPNCLCLGTPQVAGRKARRRPANAIRQGVRLAGVVLALHLLAACDVAPALPPPPVTGATGGSGPATEITKTINGAQYTGLREWSQLVQDPRLEFPLFVTYTFSPQWRHIAQEAARRRVPMKVARLDPKTGGQYLSDGKHPGQIVINELILNEPIDVQGFTIAHEIFHASHESGPGPLACLSEEAQAYAWGALAYESIIRTDPRETDWTQSAEHIVELWHQGRTQEAVLLSESYQRECLGGIVK